MTFVRSSKRWWSGTAHAVFDGHIVCTRQRARKSSAEGNVTCPRCLAWIHR